MKNTTDSPERFTASDLLAFMRGKLVAAENALRCREQMANAKPLTAEEWEELAKMPGVLVTKGRKLSKAACKKLEAKQEGDAAMQSRIAIKCRNEVDMIKAVIAALEANA
jgi:hypothetical protein